MAQRWKIIENAGYVGENKRPGEFASQSAAWEEVERLYEPDEREALHVDVAHWEEVTCGGVGAGGFWSYDH